MAELHHGEGHPVHPSVHHEERDINVRAVMWGTALFVVLTVIMLIGLWGLFIGFRWIDRSLDPEKVSAVAEDANEISLLEGADPEVPLFIEDWVIGVERRIEREHAEEKVLTEWGWVDEGSGRVRLPIEQAKALALQRGYAVRDQAVPADGMEQPSWMIVPDPDEVLLPVNRNFDEASLDEGEGLLEGAGQ